jgi:hypothetical protein
MSAWVQMHALGAYQHDQEHDYAVRELIDQQPQISGPRRASNRATRHHAAEHHFPQRTEGAFKILRDEKMRGRGSDGGGNRQDVSKESWPKCAQGLSTKFYNI